jgi:ribonuclease HI
VEVVVHVDGGARGNPGPAAAASVVSSPEGDVLDETAVVLGTATNNVAEYRALLLGLEQARALGATAVDVINDSELVAKQITGAYKVKGSSAGRSDRSRARTTPPPTRSSTRRSTRPATTRPPSTPATCGSTTCCSCSIRSPRARTTSCCS